MKRFSSTYRALVWLFIYCLSCQAVWAADEKGILWRIEGAANQPSYLLGTIHSDDVRVTNIPASVAHAFQQADSFSGEIKMDLPSLMQASQATLLSDGQSLEQLIEPTLYKKGQIPLLIKRGRSLFANWGLKLPRILILN